MSSRSIAVAAVSAVVLAFGVGHGYAQVTTGTLVGLVRDATGAIIPNTPVTATNRDTNVVYRGVTNGSGEYRIGNLPGGFYNISILATGFAPAALNDLEVEANTSRTGDLTVSVALQSVVVVTSEASVSIDTTTAQIGSTFSMKETQDLPTASVGLGVLNLSLLAPGVTSSGGLGAGTGPSVGGQRPRNNNFEIDGVDNNSKSVTGPLLYTPNDAVGEFTLLQNVYSAQYGHSTGGQFNSLILAGTNSFHGRLYEYFDNRKLNAVGSQQAIANAGNGVAPNFKPRSDFNRYGGQIGGPVLKNRLFLFSNFERQAAGSSQAGSSYCAPTAAGVAALKASGVTSASNLTGFLTFAPVATSQSKVGGDGGCPNGNTVTVTAGIGGTQTIVPVGSFSVSPPLFSNSYFSTSSLDYTISDKDSLHVRYVYNRQDQLDTAASLPTFFSANANRYHLAVISENHVFSPNLNNDFRIGFNRYFNQSPVNGAIFPGLAQFPNLTFDELNQFNLGPDPNAPQGTIENLYQAIDTVTWVKGKHTVVIGGEGRKYIAPQVFVQRARGDYEYSSLNLFLNDVAPDGTGQRNALGAIGTPTFYGDQSAFYAYVNDDWRVAPTLTFNIGLRYEFTSVPKGEKLQALNSAASVPGLITFAEPKPQYKNFAPRLGFAYAPNGNTSIRAGFGINYDVLYDNIGTTGAPPQFQSTENVDPAAAGVMPNFLASGGLPANFAFTSLAQQRLATTAYVPDQKLPYSEQYTLGIEHVFLKDYTAEIRYVGTRGVHLDVQDRINVQNPVTAANQLPTVFNGSTTVAQNGTNTLAKLKLLPRIIPAYSAAGFTGNIVADVPYGGSNYNSLQSQITRRFQKGLLINAAYTFSRNMDDSTADFNTTALNPRRPQDFQNIRADYSVSALDRRHRGTITAIYDIPFFKNSNWFVKNLVGNLEISPTYTFQSPQLTTPQSGLTSNLNGDAATDRTFINPKGIKGTASSVVAIVNASIPCAKFTGTGVANGTQTVTKSCNANIIGYAEGILVRSTKSDPYVFTPTTGYYVEAGSGTAPNAPRNSLPTGRTNNLDVSLYKRISFHDRYKVEFGLQAFNSLNHPQYLPGSLNQVTSIGSAAGVNRSFTLTGNQPLITGTVPVNATSPTNVNFNNKKLVFDSNSRSLQLSGKIIF